MGVYGNYIAGAAAGALGGGVIGAGVDGNNRGQGALMGGLGGAVLGAGGGHFIPASFMGSMAAKMPGTAAAGMSAVSAPGLSPIGMAKMAAANDAARGAARREAARAFQIRHAQGYRSDAAPRALMAESSWTAGQSAPARGVSGPFGRLFRR